MPVIEYMMHRIDGSHRRAVPDFVGDRGYWPSPINNSYIGWVDDSRDYYVPDSVVTLTKEQFVARQLNIHATDPFMKRNPPEMGQPISEPVPMTEAEVTTEAETWYDEFVAKNS